MTSTLAALGLGLGLTNAYEEKRKALLRKLGIRGKYANIFRSVTGFGKTGNKSNSEMGSAGSVAARAGGRALSRVVTKAAAKAAARSALKAAAKGAINAGVGYGTDATFRKISGGKRRRKAKRGARRKLFEKKKKRVDKRTRSTIKARHTK